MKKQIIAFAALLFTLILSVQQIISNPTGAPLQASGGPAEGGATCAQSGCHFGSATAATDIITTDIPAEGYTPEATYNITATVIGNGAKGLMMSAQNPSGSFLGTLISAPGTKIVFTNYITHTTNKNGTPAVWTFKWKAPAKGAGAVTFYGAFAATRDVTRKQSVTIPENAATSIEEVKDAVIFNAYPNPIINQLTLALDLPQNETITITMQSIDGKKSKVLFEGVKSSGKQEASFDVSDMNNGVYLINIITPTSNTCRKVLINK